jgi:hypothetical protein
MVITRRYPPVIEHNLRAADLKYASIPAARDLVLMTILLSDVQKRMTNEQLMGTLAWMRRLGFFRWYRESAEAVVEWCEMGLN